ncbi:MAG: hypothetical protein ACK5BR_00800 [Bacteroidota bacterium]|jgi:hypothetical protein|nr:hypothetical protein [Algoriphagus sp.]
MNQQNYNLTLGDYFLGNKRIKGQAKPITEQRGVKPENWLKANWKTHSDFNSKFVGLRNQIFEYL